MESKQILEQLGKDEMFSAAMRKAFTDGFRAIVATERIGAVLNVLAQPSSAAGIPVALSSQTASTSAPADGPDSPDSTAPATVSAVTPVSSVTPAASTAQAAAPAAEPAQPAAVVPAVEREAAPVVATPAAAPEASAKPKPKPDAKPAPRGRWSPEEDARLREEFAELVEQHNTRFSLVSAIAPLHNRSVMGIALRLQVTHGLLSETEVNDIKATSHAVGPTSQASAAAQAPESVKKPPVDNSPVRVVDNGAKAPSARSVESASDISTEPQGAYDDSDLPPSGPHDDTGIPWDDHFAVAGDGAVEAAAPAVVQSPVAEKPQEAAPSREDELLEREMELVSDAARETSRSILARYKLDERCGHQLLDYLRSPKMVERIPQDLRIRLMKKIGGNAQA